jgi:site-specific recombinase XerD
MFFVRKTSRLISIRYSKNDLRYGDCAACISIFFFVPMAKTKLIIRSHRRNGEGKSSIFVRFSHIDRSCFFATGVVIDQKYWDGKQETVRKSLPGFSSLNSLLTKKKLEVDEIVIRLRLSDREISVDAVRNEFNRKFKAIDVVDEPAPVKHLLPYYDEFVVYQRDIKRLAQGTLVQYSGTRKRIVAFEEYLGKQLTLKDLNKELAEQYIYFEFKICGNSNNTVGSRVKMLRTFNNYLMAQSLISDNTFKNVKKPGNKTDIIALSFSQINELMQLDLSSSPKLEKVRDLYCFNSNVGLRFSDLNTLTSANFKDDFVVVRTKKTDTHVRIPMNATAKKIAVKYNYDLPKLSNVKFNKYLKELGEWAKLDTEFEINKFQGGERKKVLVPLKKLLTSHQCRRNFATNCLRLGMAPSLVQKMTGHADYKSFSKYLYASDEVVAQEFRRAWDNAPGE